MPKLPLPSKAAIALAAGALMVLSVATAHAVTLGQADDFEAGTTAGWSEGAPSTNPPTNESSGGPDGVDDNFLSNVSSGIGNPGSRQVMFNRDQWTGDYTGQGIQGVRMQAVNLGDGPLYLRIAFQGSNGTRWATTDAFELPADGVWRTAHFGLTEAQLTRTLGAGDLAATLTSVTEFRILSAQAGPDWIGDSVVSTLGVDDITTSESSVSTESTSWTDVKVRF